MRKLPMLFAVAGVALAACSHPAPPPPPAPEPQPQPSPEVALNQHIQDSIAAYNLAYADSVERARVAQLAMTARADSMEQARMMAQKNMDLRTELGTMVHFDVARSELQQVDRDALDRKIEILNANPMVRLRITGATDERGSDAYNMALGTRRADAVKLYLTTKGISASRLDGMSDGEGSPIDSGNNEAAWVQNRRAEFTIVSGDLPLAMK